ncbi:MAG TPA: DUF2341 domain-containing protein [Acetobacteraceae bacterium]|nr:DUF2341 domain-containing protein [Acetobacteraceae bacterium]
MISARLPVSWRRVFAAFFLVAAFLVAGAAPAAADDWWNGDWQYRDKIDADAGPKGADIGEAIGRTAVLVKLTQGNFKFEQAKDDGSDLRFVAADNKTLLHYHVELWDGLLNQVALIWVDVPDLAPGATTSFYMYWGNAKAPSIADSKSTYDDNQLLVWHFGGTRGVPKDATQYGFDGLTSFTPEQAGEIGWGAKLDGTSPIKLPDNKLLHFTANQPLTWQIWLSPTPATQTSVLYDVRDVGGVADFQIGLAGGVPYAQATPVTGAAVVARAGAAIDAKSTWHLLTVTASDKLLDLYVDGAKVGEAPGALPDIVGAPLLGGAVPVAAASPSTAAPLPAGAPAPAAATPAAAPANFTGLVDELEISNIVRPVGAIQMAFHNEGIANNLLRFEAPEQTSAFSTGYIGILLHSITPDAEVVIGILMVMMLISWVVMANRAMVVGASRGANKRFLVVLRDTYRKNGRDLMPALPKDATKLRASGLYAIYQTGYREVTERLEGGRCLPDGSIAPQSLAAIRSAMDGQMVREGQRLNNMMVLLTIAISGGPFIGLLGTVIGVMITFAAIAASGDVNVNSIAPGIAAALLATVAGLSVAIPSLFGYNYFQTRIKESMSDMAVFVDEIVTRIAEGHIGGHTPQAGE